MTNSNIWVTVLALAIYLTSGGGGKSSPAQPGTPSYTVPSSSQSSGQSTKAVQISTQLASLRQEGKNGSEVIGTLAKGTKLVVESENSNWYKVRTKEGQAGWVARWMTQPSDYYPTESRPGWEVVGYYAENYSGDKLAYSSFVNNLNKITSVAPFLYQVDGHGNVTGRNDTNLLSVAKARGIQTLALVNNVQGDNFNTRTVDQMLNNSASRSRAINGILRLLVEHGYSGVNIDFEGVPARDRYKLTSFFRELSGTLRPRNLLVTASLPAKSQEDTKSLWGGAYDYASLAPYLDRAMIMTYDQHYKSGSAGPVAALNWVEDVIRYTTKYFAPSRVLMGIAAYGYDWTYRSGKALTYSGIERLIENRDIQPRWHPTYQVPYFTYTSLGVRHEVWYEDRNSTAAKVRLAAKYGLKGVAVWRLGYEDPGIWGVM